MFWVPFVVHRGRVLCEFVAGLKEVLQGLKKVMMQFRNDRSGEATITQTENG